MKLQKILLDTEEEHEITLGLVRLIKDVPDYELFYHLNNINSFKFYRIGDFVFQGNYYDYYFPRFEAFHPDSNTQIYFISNKSCQSIQKKKSTELFSLEQETKFLLDNFQDVDYLIKTSDSFGDFSVISLPENLLFQIQDYVLAPDEELYQMILYYE